jgi:hypothetical protein
MAASQSMAAIGMPPLVPCSMNRLVKSSRCKNVWLLMSSSVPASSGAGRRRRHGGLRLGSQCPWGPSGVRVAAAMSR